ncbi:MAG: TetR/AcrR family transcriptional regulator, partial [Candidatus Binatia bacterium]
DRILDAAEELFAKQGFSATSLRNVISEAAVNLAAVHYHFGSREELIKAVFARRFEPINRERIELLDVLESNTARGSKRLDHRLERILDILLSPLLRAARDRPEEWSSVSLLVGRAHTDPDFVVRQILHDQFLEVFARFSSALGQCLPALGEEELLCRFHFVITAMAVTLVHGDDIRTLSDGKLDPGRDPEVFARRWVAFAAAGLRAPASDNGEER